MHPDLYRTSGPNQNQFSTITITGSHINTGFTITFDAGSSADGSIAEFIPNSTNLVGDTVDVTTITDADGFAFLPTQQSQPPYDFHQPGNLSPQSNLGAVPGTWWLHGVATWFNPPSGVGAEQVAIRINGVTVAISTAPINTPSQTTGEIEWVGEIVDGDTVGLYASNTSSGIQLNNYATYLEGLFLGKVVS